jgi:xanthine/CO dehydrogenase XdhC/CoxF family maturation factor
MNIKTGDTGSLTVNANAEILVTGEEAEWGERISFGMFLGEQQWILRPLNMTAAKTMDSSHLVAIMLHDRVQELEARLKALENRVAASPESL